MTEKSIRPEFEDRIGQSYGVPEIDDAFAARLEAELMQRADRKMARRALQASRLRWGLGLSAAILLLGLFFLAAPQGRALAEAIGHLFKIATVTEIPIEDPAFFATPTYAPTFKVTLVPVGGDLPSETPAPPASVSQGDLPKACETDPYGYACEINRAEQKIGYDIQEFPADPEGLRYEELYVFENKDVQITYVRVSGGGYLFFSEGLGGEFTNTTSGVPADAVQAVSVGGFPGEYVVGNYFARPNDSAYHWIPSGTYRLRWANDERWYEIRYEGCAGPDDAWCTSEGLIRLGESLVDDPNAGDPSAVCEDDPYGYACKIYWAEKRVGYDIREFATDPIDMRFRQMRVEENEDVFIQYERVGGGTYLNFNQGLAGEFSPGSLGVPAEAIEPVMVGEYPGEFVNGGFETEAGSTTYSWNDAARYTLRWKEGERWYEIQYWGCVGREDYCSAEGLVQLALTLVDHPQPNPGPRADYLKSVAEAEQISGLDLLEPAILPEGFTFSYGTFDAETGQVILHYQPVGYIQGAAEIGIWLAPIDATLPSATGSDGESVDIHGKPGYYQSSDAYSHWITWQENGLSITLDVVSSDLWYGGTFTREQVLEVARSMK